MSNMFQYMLVFAAASFLYGCTSSTTDATTGEKKVVMRVGLDLLILAVGFFIDVSPALLLLCPILVPVLKQFGVGEVQFGAIMIVGLAIGLVTPPVGMCLNAGAKISGIPITDIFRGALPFVVCNLLILLLVTFVPEISLWLPSLISKQP